MMCLIPNSFVHDKQFWCRNEATSALNTAIMVVVAPLVGASVLSIGALVALALIVRLLTAVRHGVAEDGP